MVWTATQLAEKTGLTRQHITRLLRKGKEIKANQPEASSTANWIIGEQTTASWIILDDEAEKFIQAREADNS